MRKINILYSGCSLSGKLSSIESIAGSFGGNVTLLENIYKNGFSTKWFFRKNYDLNLLFKKYSLGDYYKHNEKIETSDEVKKEIDFIEKLDGIIYVIDSQKERKEKNIESFNLLKQTMTYFNKEIESIPIVFQINKRDLPEIYGVQEIKKLYKNKRCSYKETVATKPETVRETINEMIDLIELK